LIDYLGAVVPGYQEHFDFGMAFDFVGEGVGVKHNSTQDSSAAVYGLRHDFLELGRHELHLANLVNDYEVAFLERLTQGGNPHSIQSIRVHPVFADLTGAGDVGMG
jgi:hypothetical protein